MFQRTDPSAEMVMLWRIFVHEEKSALAQEKKLAVEGANGTPVAAPSPSTSQEPAEPPAAALPVVGTATTAYLQPSAPTNTFPKSTATVTTSRSLTAASSVLKPHTKTVTQDPLMVQGRTVAAKVAVPVARGVAVPMETKEPSDEESEDEVDMADTVGASQPAMSYLNIDSSSMIEAVKATSPARLKSESEMAVASLLGEDSVDIDILNSDIANSDLPEDPGVDAVRSLTGALSPTRRNLNLDAAANDFEDDSDEEPDSLNEQVQSAINSILELQGRGPLDEEDSPQDVFNPFSQDPPCSTSSEQNIDEDNALDEAVKSILF
ncbi:uncharacterized protein LOC118403129 [Branchiostoma floridae]|uniref:Uncharacterized protein LOC118403129 n=1 Tax=Branchiostoma floridae TaxID=7739 RepID=A0A9J7HFK7_BRAFL|nr:uncharacterized protein LOC118403129 [Branchiostoma floridae]